MSLKKVEEEIKDLEALIARKFGELSSDEQRALAQILEAHEKQIHLSKADISSEVIRIIEASIK